MFDEEEVVKSHDLRVNQILVILVFAMGVLFSRLFYLQIIKGKSLHEYSIKNRLREEVLWAPRGKIYDKNDRLLIDNRPRFDVVLVRQYLQQKNETLDKLSKLINMERKKINKVLKKYSTEPKYKPIIIKKNISFEELANIETLPGGLPGINVQVSIARNYLDEEVGSHLLGYISEISSSQLPRYKKRDELEYRLGDFIGQSGIEKYFDKYLRGQNGRQYVQVDALGRKRKYQSSNNLFKTIKDIPANAGNALKLTVDWDLQEAAFKMLEGKSGGAVAVDVNTGEILAMVSTPGFRSSDFSQGIGSSYWKELITNKNRPLRDKVIQEHYSPGSTFKIVTAIAGLTESIVTPRTEVYCDGSLKFGRRRYHCWKRGGHGSVNLVKAIKESCNVYFQKIAIDLDIDTLAYYARLMGFGKKTGIPLPRETSGLIPDKAWKKKRRGIKWLKGETLSCAIGQSYILSTPLQLALAYASLTNGGKIYKPQLVKSIFNKKGKLIKEFESEVSSEFNIPKNVISKIREGLFKVVNERGGTAYYYRDPGALVAGKTGTSQVFRAKASEVYNKCEDMPYEKRHHGLFSGFAPANNPKIAFAIIVEHGCHGSKAASPVAMEMAKVYMKKYYPVEYEKNKNVKVYREI